METALMLLFNAVVAGAAAALKPTAQQAITDAYSGLKKLFGKQLAARDIEAIEQAPTAPENQQALQAALKNSSALADVDILEQAQLLLQQIERYDVDAALDAGITIADLHANTEIDIEDLIAYGGAVKVTGLNAGGAIRIKGVQAGNPQQR